MSKLIIRDWQYGRLLSQDPGQLIADIFVNKGVLLQCQDDPVAQAKRTLVCVHWDRWQGSSMASVTLTHRREEDDEKFARIICESILKKTSCLRSFLFDAYQDLDTKLVEVRIRPITFIFVNTRRDPFLHNRHRILKLFKQLISDYLSTTPEVVVKHKVLEKFLEPCNGLVHGDKPPKNQRQLKRLSESDKGSDEKSMSETFHYMHEKIELQNEYMEREFSSLQRHTDDIRNMLSLALDLVTGKSSSGTVQEELHKLGCQLKRGEVSINTSDHSQEINVESRGSLFQGNQEGITTVEDSDDQTGAIPKNPATMDDERQEILTYPQETVTNRQCDESWNEISHGPEESQQIPTMETHHHGDKDKRLTSKTSSVSKVSETKTSSHVTSAHLFPKSRSSRKSGASIMTLDDIKNEETGTRYGMSLGHVLGRRGDNPSSKPGTHHKGLRTLAEIKEEEWRKSMQKKENEPSKLSDLLSRMSLGSMVTSDPLSKLLMRRGSPIADRNFLEVIGMSLPEDRGFAETMIQVYKSALMTNDNSATLPVTKEGMDTVLCIDTSSSISGVHLQRMKEIIKHFLSAIEETAAEHDIEENIGLVIFGGQARILHHLTNDYGSLRDIIETLDVGGTTPLVDAIAVAFACLEKGGICRFGEIMVPPRIIFLTDGMPTVEDKEMSSDALTSNDQTKQQFVNKLEKFHPKLLLAGRNIWIPTGNADRSFIKSVARLCDGELVEGEDVGSLARHQHTMRAVGQVLQVVRTEQLTTGNVDAITNNAIEMVAPDLSVEEKAEVKGAVLKHLLEHNETPETEDFDNIVQISGLPPLGSRVRRGPDWKWNEQDNHGPGTVYNHDLGDKGWVSVRWDSGKSNCYRYGNDNAYDVLISEDKPPAVTAQRVEIGVLVERGPHWLDSFENQDGGQGNDGVVIRKRGQRVMVRWKATESIHQYSFGENDKYEVSVRNPDYCDLKANTVPNRAKENATSKSDEQITNQQGTRSRAYVWQKLNDKNRWEDYSATEDAILKVEYDKDREGVCLLMRDGKSYQISFRMETERSLADNSWRRIRKLYSDICRK